MATDPVLPQSENQTTVPPQRRSNRRWPIIIAVILIAFIVLLIWQKKSVARESTAIVPTVAAARVLREDLAQEQDFDAEFRPYQEIDLHAKVAGFVQSINVDIGDSVQAGQLLATLEIPELKEDLERATAEELRGQKEIDRAQAAYQDAHLAFTRLTAINQSHANLVAQQELDVAQDKDSSAAAALAAANAQEMVDKAEANKLKAEQDYCKITAPFTGVITRRYADVGTFVQGGVSPSANAMPLVRLSQNDRLRLDFPVSVSYVGKIKTGDPVQIHIQALNRTLSGTISRFARKVDADTRTMAAEVDVTNADLSLTPGIYATAALTLERREKVLAVPPEAIAHPSAPTVFILKDNVIEERPVTLGLATASRQEILSGVSENELVMLGSRAGVRPGEKVQPKLAEMGSLQ